jgi:hypothetical protein
MGVMDASEPSVYNDKVEWYKPRGCKNHIPFALFLFTNALQIGSIFLKSK